ncbi:MAG: thiol:disulfide interchange protein DsbA/DsbL [Sulfuricella sp.]|nr:thiol:disulfide interchange protein DsbA/DsbL [Sulfuricella sp.]
MKQIKFLLLALLSCVALVAHADPKLGVEYSVVSQPQPPADPKKIEVTEVFSYACPHCAHLEPEIAKWSKTLPKDAVLVRLHAATNPTWAALAKLFYALESLGEIERLNGDAFNAFHGKDLKLQEEKVATEWASKMGIDAKKFTDAYNSFGVQSKIARSKQLTGAYGINGVPTIVVGGKYQTSASQAGSHEAALKVTDYLITLVRHERGGK